MRFSSAIDHLDSLLRRLSAVAVLLIGLCWMKIAAAADQHVTVALDFTGLSDQQYTSIDGLALEKHLVLRLVQEGFAVVTPQSNPEMVIRVEVRQNVVVLRSTHAGHDEMRQIEWDRRTERDWVHLELSQKVAELARTTLSGTARPNTAPAKEEAPATLSNTGFEQIQTPERFRAAEGSGSSAEQGGRSIAASGRSRPARGGGVEPQANSRDTVQPALAIRVAGGAAIRPPAADLVGRMDVGVKVYGPWHAEAGIGLLPSSAPGVRILEMVPTVGVAFELVASADWSFGAGARAGLLLHTYALNNADTSATSGLAADGVVAMPLSVARRLLPSLRLDVTAAPLLATRGRSHLLNGESLWHRGPGQLELTAGITVTP